MLLPIHHTSRNKGDKSVSQRQWESFIQSTQIPSILPELYLYQVEVHKQSHGKQCQAGHLQIDNVERAVHTCNRWKGKGLLVTAHVTEKSAAFVSLNRYKSLVRKNGKPAVSRRT